jgi:hypothetical protein
MGFQIATQGMQPPAGGIHVSFRLGIVQGSQLQAQSFGVLGLDFRLRTGLEEPFDALMAKLLITLYSV